MDKSATKIQKYKKSGRKIVSLTAYDYNTAKVLDEADIDIILVGDSLAMVALGHKDTLSITMDEMIHHTKAVTRGASKTMVVADMPFMSYQVDVSEAVRNAGRFVKEAGANAVKLEGSGDHIIESVRRIIDSGIPVLGHLGFTPQFINNFGGYFIQAKTASKGEILLNEALKLEKAGVFGLVLEMIPSPVGKYVSENLKIPTIGIGAGPNCDGQILVTDDLLGKYADFTPSFVRKYANLFEISKSAVMNYRQDVIDGSFPDEIDESFALEPEEEEKLNFVKR
ncbi:MAG: 3-methyl-2-oxobutanoate hydroxymethyltransferase [Cyanobacteriota bacterium]